MAESTAASAAGDRFHPDRATLYAHAEVEAIARAARLARRGVMAAASAAAPGRTTAELAELVRVEIERGGGEPLFATYTERQGPPFGAAASVCVNDEVVHAPPAGRALAAGDLVTVDAGVRLEGWCADTAHSLIVGGDPPGGSPASALLRALNACMREARRLVAPGVRWSVVATAMERVAREGGCGWVAQFVGHGVGRALHEAPKAPSYWTGFDGPDFTLREGMVLAVEPILTWPAPAWGGATPVVVGDDGWTVRTAEGALAAYEEHMLAVTRTGCRVLSEAPLQV